MGACLAALLVPWALKLLLSHSRRCKPDLDPLTAHPTVRREVLKKERLRAKAACGAKQRCAEGNGLPEGQTAAKKWILLDLGLRPAAGAYSLEPSEWKLSVLAAGGGSAAFLTMDDVRSMGVQRYDAHRWHCVTGWSALDLDFEGVPLANVLGHPKVRAIAGDSAASWSWLYQRGADGYTAPVARDDAADCFLALSVNGEPIPFEHGGPRLVLPSLFGWKSAKWLLELELCDAYRPGFWERCGCHPRGRVRLNERFREGWSAAIWSWLAAAPGAYRRVGGYDVWICVMQAGGTALGALVSRFTSLHAVSRRSSADATAR
jgi:DMSO/TMAO reductase YedYZ molybdopterin-dependent catalytic subunit